MLKSRKFVIYVFVLIAGIFLLIEDLNKSNSKEIFKDSGNFKIKQINNTKPDSIKKEVDFIKRDLAVYISSPEVKLGREILSEKILGKYSFLRGAKLLSERILLADDENIERQIRIFNTDFKYPNIRVVEETHGVTKESLSTQVMVADHLLVKVNDGWDIRSIEKGLNDLGARIGKQKKYSKIYYFEFDLGDLEREDRFDQIEDFLKKHDDILTSNPDRIFTIY